MQNVALAATALRLRTCQLGGFFDHELGGLVRLEADREVALYASAIGLPIGGDREVRRAVEQAAGQ